MSQIYFIRVEEEGFFCRFQNCSLKFETKGGLQHHFYRCHPDVEWNHNFPQSYQPGAPKGLIVFKRRNPKMLELLTNNMVKNFPSESLHDLSPPGKKSPSTTSNLHPCKNWNLGGNVNLPQEVVRVEIGNASTKVQLPKGSAVLPGNGKSPTNTVSTRVHCPQCNKSYSSKSNFNQHLIVHSGYVLQCPRCRHVANRKCNLVVHIQRVHLIERGFATQMATRAELKKKNYEKPESYSLQKEKMDTSDTFKCPLCEFSTRFNGNLVVHIRKFHRVEKYTAEQLAVEVAPNERATTMIERCTTWSIAPKVIAAAVARTCRRPEFLHSSTSASTGGKAAKRQESCQQATTKKVEISTTKPARISCRTCPYCPYKGNSKEVLQSHLRVHEDGSGAVKCRICQWVVLRNKMKHHQVFRHLGEKCFTLES